MMWHPIETAPRDFTRVLVLTAAGAKDVNVKIASQSPTTKWLSDNGQWLNYELAPTHWQPLPSTDLMVLSDAAIKSMLIDVLLGIGMLFDCTLEEIQEDPSIIITRIEQSLGPNGPRRRSDA